MKIKKTRIDGIKMFQAPKGLMNINDDSEIVKKALEEKPIKKWYQEVKQNKADTILFDNENGEAYQATTITKNKKIYAGVAPNLIQAYFDIAHEQIQWTNKYANTFHYIAKKKFGWIVNQLYTNQDRSIDLDVLRFAKMKLSIFLNTQFEEENYRNSNLYKYFHTKY